MSRAGVGDAVDLSNRDCLCGGCGSARRMALRKPIEQGGHRPADGKPVRRLLIARGGNRLPQHLEYRWLAQLRQARAPQQRPEQRIGDGGSVELAQMGIAAARPAQQRVAEIVEVWAVL